MIYYFQEGFKSFIKVEIEKQNWLSTSIEKIVNKAVNAEAKVSLRSNTIVWDLDAHCFRNYHPSHNTFSKVQIQRTTAKEPCTKKSRPKEIKSADNKTPVLPCSNESANSNRKDKRREWLKKKKNSTPAIRDNAIKSKKKRIPGNTSQVTCYNCQKKGHFVNKSTSQKTSVSLGNLYAGNWWG